MIKVTLIFGSLLALGAAAVLYADTFDAFDTFDTSETSDSNEEIGCLYQKQMWGSEDGTKFYFCLSGTNTAMQQSCPKGRFFIRNATVTGCVLFADVDSQCIYLDEVGPCTGENLKQPQSAPEPTNFYLCPTENADPIKLPCPDGKAFLKQDGFLGCFNWSRWRTVRSCPLQN